MLKEIPKYVIKTIDKKKLLELENKPEQFSQMFIQLDATKFAVDMAKELKIDEHDLVSSMVNHAGNFGWWASLNETGKRLLRARRRIYEKRVGELDIESRESLKEQGIKVTEAAVKAWMTNDIRVTEQMEEISALEDIIGFTESMLKSLEHKRDMLKEINRAQCNERFNERQ